MISFLRIFTWWALVLCWETSFWLCTFLGTEELWECTHCKFVVRRLCYGTGGLKAFISSIWSYLGKTRADLPDVTMWAWTAGRTPDTNRCSQTSYTRRCFCWSCGGCAIRLDWDRLAAALDKWLLSKGSLPGSGVLGTRKIPKAMSRFHWSALWNTVKGILRRG